MACIVFGCGLSLFARRDGHGGCITSTAPPLPLASFCRTRLLRQPASDGVVSSVGKGTSVDRLGPARLTIAGDYGGARGLRSRKHTCGIRRRVVWPVEGILHGRGIIGRCRTVGDL